MWTLIAFHWDISYFSTATSFSLATLFKYTSVNLSFGTESTGEFETCLGEHCEQHYLLLALQENSQATCFYKKL